MKPDSTSLSIAAWQTNAITPQREAAEKLETAFVAEMLKASGVGELPDSFGGGTGEEQFASFLREAQAKEIVRAGGFGLAAVFEEQLLGAGK